MKLCLLSIPLIALFTVGCDKVEVEQPVKPPITIPPVAIPLDKDSDMLIKANGHWEWERNVRGFSPIVNPKETGFTRQLIFKADGHVYIYHDQKLVLKSAYISSNRQRIICKGAVWPHVEYAGEVEPEFPSNPLRRVDISKAGTAANDTTLILTGDGSCIDAGATEFYRWVRR